ncbi:hypothetical protein JMUB6875_07860 [Nocardia sp. JMUB6875]
MAWDGQRETIEMRLDLRSSGQGAALLVPTPAPATVTAGNPATFTELERLTAPQVVTVRKWFGDFRLGWGSAADGAGAMPGGGAPTVLDRVRLGPVEATTFTGGDLTGIREWLSHNGYEMREEVLATMPPYLDEGWSFVALRLTTSATLNGALDPVRLAFASDRLVYPMRMSRAAAHPQKVRVYVRLPVHPVSGGRPVPGAGAPGGVCPVPGHTGRFRDPAGGTAHRPGTRHPRRRVASAARAGA